MSRHLFSTTIDDRPVTIVAGWDPPRNCFFLDIEREDTDELCLLYSSDKDPRLARAKSFYTYVGKLAAFGIELPQAMIDAVVDDETNSTANRIQRWHAEAA